MNDVNPGLKELVLDLRGEYSTPLEQNTRLYDDLSIWGDDAFEFIVEYGKRFNVDVSEFDINKYFKPEGDAILASIIRFIMMKPKKEYAPLTLGDLEKGIEAGKLL